MIHANSTVGSRYSVPQYNDIFCADHSFYYITIFRVSVVRWSPWWPTVSLQRDPTVLDLCLETFRIGQSWDRLWKRHKWALAIMMWSVALKFILISENRYFSLPSNKSVTLERYCYMESDCHIGDHYTVPRKPCTLFFGGPWKYGKRRGILHRKSADFCSLWQVAQKVGREAPLLLTLPFMLSLCSRCLQQNSLSEKTSRCTR